MVFSNQDASISIHVFCFCPNLQIALSLYPLAELSTMTFFICFQVLHAISENNTGQEVFYTHFCVRLSTSVPWHTVWGIISLQRFFCASSYFKNIQIFLKIFIKNFYKKIKILKYTDNYSVKEIPAMMGWPWHSSRCLRSCCPTASSTGQVENIRWKSFG